MARNLRGAYMTFAHDRKEDWDWLAAWQPAVVRLMLHGSHSDPNSVSVSLIERVHRIVPNAQIILRVWDVDDRNFEAHEAMRINPTGEAEKQLMWWDAVISRTNVPRHLLIAGLNNEVFPDKYRALYEYTKYALIAAKRRNLRVGVGVFSVGNPALPGDAEYNINKFAELDPLVVDGNHVWILHEYMQPEGMYGVWTDQQGRERKDYGYLIGRHKRWPIKGNIVIGEWGIEGILYNRNRDPQWGNAGWLHFPHLWPASRYADEYIACVRDAASNVIGICPFLSDFADHRWQTADLMPAYGEFLARKHLCEVEGAVSSQPDSAPATVHLPQISNGGSVSQIIDPLVGATLVKVESGGQPFGPDGRVLIRFENHIFKTKLNNDALYNRHFVHGSPIWTGHKFRRGERDSWQEVHTGNQSSEYAAFEFALSLNRDAAFQSISMGLGQIMGFNARRVGYPSAEAMFNAFSNRDNQVFAFINFFLSDSTLARAVSQRDWRTIARLYNGPGNVDHVAPLLERTYSQFVGA